MKVDCCECTFYDGYCCMFQYACKAILNEIRICENFKKGDYSEKEVEKSFP